MTEIDTLYALSHSRTNEVRQKAIKALMALKDHPDKTVRVAVTKRFIGLIISGDDQISVAVLDNFKDVDQECCCCVRYAKVMGLSELARSSMPGVRLSAVQELLKLKNDSSSKVRFAIVHTLNKLPGEFFEQYPELAQAIRTDYSEWMADPNDWVRQEAEQNLLVA